MVDTTEQKKPSEITSWQKVIFNAETRRVLRYKALFGNDIELDYLSDKEVKTYINSQLTKFTSRDTLNLYGRVQVIAMLVSIARIPVGVLGVVAGAAGSLVSGLANLFVNTKAATNLQKKSQSLIATSLLSMDQGVGTILGATISLVTVPLYALWSKATKGDLNKAVIINGTREITREDYNKAMDSFIANIFSPITDALKLPAALSKKTDTKSAGAKRVLSSTLKTVDMDEFQKRAEIISKKMEALNLRYRDPAVKMQAPANQEISSVTAKLGINPGAVKPANISEKTAERQVA